MHPLKKRKAREEQNKGDQEQTKGKKTHKRREVRHERSRWDILVMPLCFQFGCTEENLNLVFPKSWLVISNNNGEGGEPLARGQCWGTTVV